MTLNASTLCGLYLGESEAKLRSVFALARQISPSVIFLDQLEALAAKRDANSADSTGINNPINPSNPSYDIYICVNPNNPICMV